jgi:hypothetical protein
MSWTGFFGRKTTHPGLQRFNQTLATQLIPLVSGPLRRQNRTFQLSRTIICVSVASHLVFGVVVADTYMRLERKDAHSGDAGFTGAF